MRIKKVALAMLALSLQSQIVEAALCNSTWTSTGSNWNTSSNWTPPCVPTLAGSTALFPNRTISFLEIDVPNPNLTNLTIDAPTTTYFFTGGGGSDLDFEASLSGTLPTLDILNGDQIFNLPVRLRDDTTFDIRSTVTFTPDSSIIKTGAGGSLFITGTSTGTLINQTTIGPVHIEMNGSTLLNDKSIQLNGTNDTFIATGSAIVSGRGTFSNMGAYTVLNSARFKPGNDIGPGRIILNGSGTYKQTSLGVLQIDILNNKNFVGFGQIIADKAILDGTLEVVALPGFKLDPNTSLPIVVTTNGVTGAFSSIEAFNLPFLDPVVTYLSNEVLLSFEALPYLGNFYQPIFSAVTQMNIVIDSQISRMRARANDLKCNCFDTSNISIYADGIGSWGKYHTKRNSLGFNYHSAGAFVGMDFASAWGGIGAVIDYERINGTGLRSLGCFDIDHIHGSIYGTYLATESLSFNGIVGGSHDCVSLSRRPGTQSVRRLQGRPDSNLFDAYLGAEYYFDSCISQLEIVPLLGIQYINLNVGNYQERENREFSGFRVEHRHIHSVRSLLGLKANYALEIGMATVIPEVNFIWEREFQNNHHLAHFAAVGGDSFALKLNGLGGNIGLAGINILVLFSDCFGVEASYEFEGNDYFYNHFFTAGVNLTF